MPARSKSMPQVGASLVHPEPDQRGFLLIEALVGVAIFAICLGVAFAAASDAFGWLDRGRRTSTAWTIAQSTMERIGHDIPLREGDFTEPARDGFRWHAAISALAPPDPELPAASARPPRSPLMGYRVEVHVAWQDRGRVHQVSLRTVLLGPAVAM